MIFAGHIAIVCLTQHGLTTTNESNLGSGGLITRKRPIPFSGLVSQQGIHVTASWHQLLKEKAALFEPYSLFSPNRTQTACQDRFNDFTFAMHVPWHEDLANTRLYELACSKAIRTLIFGTMWRQNARDFATIYKATQLPYVTEVCRLPGFEEMWRISAHIKAGIPAGGRQPNFNLGLEDILEEDESARGLNSIDSEDAREEYRESYMLLDSDEMLCDSFPREEIDAMEVDFDAEPSFARDYNIAQPVDGSFRICALLNSSLWMHVVKGRSASRGTNQTRYLAESTSTSPSAILLLGTAPRVHASSTDITRQMT
ncbi:hypothetical protein PHLCEN_2v9541 [Hermanssonia centrifuga]|uniref:Uncharacterized protein n=1 Tax=Hermanssonia centrifuga TaxID=98765 RepID=A0A2R6NQJ2_9APHY|nr:hypothetical protein PHLCEN_2v9541 [Hermanssonia centrifuga]